ncbi:MAG: DUF1931 domain-containing protein [Candidatus Diapherotrites archaeon]|nr:DUF1931 domain-containing protein [Candidatus Diapherotrites archaeon]
MADILVVQSKVKDEIKKRKMNTAGDFSDALSKEVRAMIDRASARARSNGRKTVRATDL